MRTLALAQERGKPSVKSEAGQKNWRWSSVELLPFKSKKLLSLLTEREKEVLFLLVSGIVQQSDCRKTICLPGYHQNTYTQHLYEDGGEHPHLRHPKSDRVELVGVKSTIW